MDIGRNDPCPCGSGKKYKRCCLGKGDPAERERSRRFLFAALGVVILAFAIGFFAGQTAGLVTGGAGLLLLGVALWLTAPPPRNPSGTDPGAINFGR